MRSQHTQKLNSIGTPSKIAAVLVLLFCSDKLYGDRVNLFWESASGSAVAIAGDPAATVLGLNDAGVLVGYGAGNAYVWPTPSEQQLFSAGFARSIDDNGDVVGSLSNGKAVIWDSTKQAV